MDSDQTGEVDERTVLGANTGAGILSHEIYRYCPYLPPCPIQLV